MAEGRRGDEGGILSLVALIDDQRQCEALESDLINAGMRLRWFPAPDYSWRDLLVFIAHLGPGAALSQVQLGDDAPWGLSEQLAAMQVDYLRLLVWMKTKDGQLNRNRPKPIPRPGVDDGKDRKKIGGDTTLPAAEMAQLLGIPVGNH